jgi:hypothetical protein
MRADMFALQLAPGQDLKHAACNLHQAALQRAFFFAASAASSAGVLTLLIDVESTVKPPRFVTCAATQVPARMWASSGAGVAQPRRRCGPAPAQMWASPGVDVAWAPCRL